jgi:prepilin-type N-terminal cleavage/methylation domain-containing protein
MSRFGHLRRGGTLLELLLVVAILAILGFASVNAFSYFRDSVEIEEGQNDITRTLREARGKAMAGEQGYAWGVRFDNTDTSAPTFTLFAGTSFGSSNTTTVHFLSPFIEYESPAGAATLDMVFSKRGGTTTAATTTIRLRNRPTVKKDTHVSAQGAIQK